MMIEELAKTPKTVAELIENAQQGSALSDAHIAESIGCDNPAITTLLKQGKMRLPIPKVPQMAEVLEVKPSKLMQMVLREISQETLEAIEACYGPMVLTDAEARLIRSIRQSAGGRESAIMMFDKEAVVALVVAAPCA